MSEENKEYVPPSAERMSDAEIEASCRIQSSSRNVKYDTEDLRIFWREQMLKRGMTPPEPDRSQ